MSNILPTNNMIAKEALMAFKNKLVMAKTVNRQYQSSFNNQTGQTIRIKEPVYYNLREGRISNVQPIEQRTTTLVVGQYYGVDVELTSVEKALYLDDLTEQVINPAMLKLANRVDMSLYETSIDIYNAVGTAGSSPNTFAVVNNAGALLSSYGVSTENRYAMFSTTDGAALQNALYNTFNEPFNKQIILQGMMGNLAGFDCYQVQNTIRPQVATTTDFGTPQIVGDGQSGATLSVDGLTANMTIYKGANFTIAGVYGVNPVGLNELVSLKQFIVTADTVVNGSGQATLPISPEIILTGPYQNVSAAPANDALLTFVNQRHTYNVAYQSEAFTLAMIELPVTTQDGVFQATMTDKQANVTIRMSRQYDIRNDVDLLRFDVFFGAKCFPRYGAIIQGA